MGGRRAGCGRHIALATVASIMLTGCSVGGVYGSATLDQPKTPEPKISLADESSKDSTPPPPPRPVKLPPLPETGIVVGHGKVVDLYALDGQRLHRLKGFRLHGHDETMRVSMTKKGFAYELVPRRNLLRPRLKKVIRLRPAGRLKAIENDKGRPAGYMLHVGDGTQRRLSKRTSVWVSSDRTVLSVTPWDRRRAGFTISSATGEQRPLPQGCRVGAVVQEKWIGICNRGRKGEAAAEAWMDILSPDGTTSDLVPPPDHEGHLIGGHWRSVTPSPDGAWLLAQWSGECEVPTAFFAPAAGGEPRPVTGEGPLFSAPTSEALGWIDDRTALVHLREGLCSHGTDEPGLYRIGLDESTSLILPLPDSASVAMWAP